MARRWMQAGVAAGLVACFCACEPPPDPASPSAAPTASPTGASAETPTASPSPAPTVAPTPTASPSPTPSPTPQPPGLRVRVLDNSGEAWAGAMVFAGLDGRGPAVATGEDGLALLPPVEGPTSISVYHTYTTRYSARDSYTVSRISTFAGVEPDGEYTVTLFRDTDYGGEPRPVAFPAGTVSGVATADPATRVFVVGGGDEFEAEPTAAELGWALQAPEIPRWLYAAQVEVDPDGGWSAGRIPLAFDLAIGPPRAGSALSLQRSFDSLIPLDLEGADPLATHLEGALSWILPGSLGALSFYEPPRPLAEEASGAFPAPPADADWAGDRLSLTLTLTGPERSQTVDLGEVVRGEVAAPRFAPVPVAVTRLPLRSASLPGTRVELDRTTGAQETLFYFTERWFRLEGITGGFTLWYDLWTVSAQGGATEVEIPRLPQEIPWPAELGAVWSLLSRYAYVETRFEGASSQRSLQTASSAD